MLDQRRGGGGEERPITPKVFYKLPKRDTLLTLEFDYKNMYTVKKTDNNDDPDTEEEENKADKAVSTDAEKSKVSRKYSSENVSAWMRRSSGVFDEDHLKLCHAKLLNDTMKLCASTNDINLLSTESKELAFRRNSENLSINH